MVKPEQGERVAVCGNAKRKGTTKIRVEASTHHTLGPKKIK